MAPPLFYHPELTAGRITLSATESAHARGPRRLRVGDAVALFDGAGTVACGRIIESPAGGPVTVSVERIDRVPPETPRITLATALPKGPRQDYLIEKCTELGVDVIRPTVFERSVVKPRASKVGKWHRTAVEAAKQCGRFRLPEIKPPGSFQQMIESLGRLEAGYYGCRGETVPSLISLLERHRPGRSVLIAIGPEGGFTENEITTMQQAGLSPVTLGAHILRTETAGTAAVTIAAAWREASRRT